MLATGTDLLSVTRTLLRFGSYVLAFLAVGLVVLLATSLFGDLSLERSAMGINASSALTPEQRILATHVNLAIGLIAVVLAVVVLRLLLAIVDSARGGDPFVPANGARLRRIGWLVIAGNLVGMVVGGMVKGVDSPGLPVQFANPGFSGLLAVLLIFVLARIFETGSRMRAELQETV